MWKKAGPCSVLSDLHEQPNRPGEQRKKSDHPVQWLNECEGESQRSPKWSKFAGGKTQRTEIIRVDDKRSVLSVEIRDA